MKSSFEDPRRDASPSLSAAVGRLDRLVDWERRDRVGKSGPRMRQTLAPARDLLERLGSPEARLRCVHVAGTKGKGSVASLIAAGLRRWGVREGIYASPHVERITERVRVAGRDVDDDTLANGLGRALDAREEALREGTEGGEASWFDVLTAAGLVVFADSGCEWVVLECGLGGRLDSTNAVSSELAVLTNVDLEHTSVLGSTRLEIAREKAGIIEPTGIVVSSVGAPEDDEAGAVVARIAAERGARLVNVAIRPEASIAGRNGDLAREVLDRLGTEVLKGETRGGRPLGGQLLDPETVHSAQLPGRLERVRIGETRVVLDGAHVPRSLERVLDDLAADPELPGLPTVVLGCGREKDASALLKVLRGRVDRVLCTSLATGPVHLPEELRREAHEVGVEAESVTDPGDALHMAIDTTRSKGWVLVTGSLHLIGELRGAIVERKPGC